jgi:hypothetical protein
MWYNRKILRFGLWSFFTFCSGAAFAQLSVSINSTGASCPENSNGIAIADVKHGVGPYAYSWNTGSRSHVISDLVPGIYSVTVTDAHGDTASATARIELSSNSILQVNLSENFCQNQTVTITAEAGYSDYHWTLNDPRDVILEGQGTYSVKIRWNDDGDKNIRVQFSNPESTCSGSVEFHASVAVCNSVQPASVPVLNIAPNPFDGYMAVQTGGTTDAKGAIRLIDLYGRTIFEQKNCASHTDLKIPDLAPGQYFLFWQTEKECLIKQVVKK